MNDRLLSPTEVAERLGLKPGTLAVWRATKRGGPPYIKCGRSVKYRERAIEEYIERRTVIVEPAGAKA